MLGLYSSDTVEVIVNPSFFVHCSVPTNCCMWLCLCCIICISYLVLHAVVVATVAATVVATVATAGTAIYLCSFYSLTGWSTKYLEQR